MHDFQPPPRREPILNLPAVVTALIALLVGIHIARTFLLGPRQDQEVLLLFSFIPARYLASGLGVDFPGGFPAELWSPLTYALLHADAMHLGINSVWLAAFGSALAWRFGTGRFLIFTALAAVAGALLHYAAHSEDFVPVVGASGAISGHMAAVSRFMFQGGGIGAMRRGPAAFRAPAVSLPGILRDRRVLGFLAVWFGLNLAFGLGALAVPGEDAQIAWEAHVGGFLFGLLAFSLFDPRPRSRDADLTPGDDLPRYDG